MPSRTRFQVLQGSIECLLGCDRLMLKCPASIWVMIMTVQMTMRGKGLYSSFTEPVGFVTRRTRCIYQVLMCPVYHMVYTLL